MSYGHRYKFLRSNGLVNELFDYSEISSKRQQKEFKKYCTSEKCCKYEYIHKARQQVMHRLRAKVEKICESDICPDCGNYLVLKEITRDANGCVRTKQRK